MSNNFGSNGRTISSSALLPPPPPRSSSSSPQHHSPTLSTTKHPIQQHAKMKRKSAHLIAGVGCVLLGISFVSLYTDNTKLLLISSSVSSSGGSSLSSPVTSEAMPCSFTSPMVENSVSIHEDRSDNDSNFDGNSTYPLHLRQQPGRLPSLPLPPPTLTSSESDAPLPFNNVDYTWIGNHWIPPEGVPTYTSKQIQDYFATRNTLWLGDSTCRRAFLTAHGIINGHHDDTDTVNDDKDLDKHNHIPTSSIDGYSVIDINKQTFTLPFEQCNDREFFELNQYNNTPDTVKHQKLVRNRYEQYQSKGNRNVYLCRNVTGTSSSSLSSSTTTTVTTKHSNNAATAIPTNVNKGKFDYGNINCGKELLEFVDIELNPKLEHVAIAKEYDLIIVAIGVWEVVRPQDCKMTLEELTNNLGPHGRSQQYPESPLGHALTSIDALNKLASKHKHIQIIWRTSGYVGDSFNYDKNANNSNDVSKTRHFNNRNTNGRSTGPLSVINNLLFGKEQKENDNDDVNNINRNANAAKSLKNLKLKDKNGQPSKGLIDLINLLDLGGAQQLIHDSGIKAVDEMNRGAIDYINRNRKNADRNVKANMQQQRNQLADHSRISYIDYGKVIKPRSFYPNRIIGDIDPHYGLEARTLLVQMLIHELYRGESASSSSRTDRSNMHLIDDGNDVGANKVVSSTTDPATKSTSTATAVVAAVSTDSTSTSDIGKASNVSDGRYIDIANARNSQSSNQDNSSTSNNK